MNTLQREWISLFSDDSGSVAIVMAVMLLTVVTIIGISAINNSMTETGIATNDMIYKDAFVEADGGTEVGREVLEQNIACLGFTGSGDNVSGASGFSIDGDGDGLNAVDVTEIANEVNENGTVLTWMNDGDQDFYLREERPYLADDTLTPADADGLPDEPEYPSDTIRDFCYPISNLGEQTNVVVFGLTQHSTGSAIQLASGYEGKGKGAGAGGGEIVYQINSRFEGARDSYAIRVRWRHLIGNEDTCIY